MLKKNINLLTALFSTACLSPEQPLQQGSTEPAHLAVHSAQEKVEKPATVEGEVSLAAVECLDCVRSLSTVCVEEAAECSASLSCKVWTECTEGCILLDSDPSCYAACDEPTHEFFTPQKMKKCSCEICYAQCLNMCPTQE
jgi:hypothetical protein